VTAGGADDSAGPAADANDTEGAQRAPMYQDGQKALDLLKRCQRTRAATRRARRAIAPTCST
jgi:hypothetical protein